MNARACSATPAMLALLGMLSLPGMPGMAAADDPVRLEISDDGLETVTIRADESNGSVVRSDVVPYGTAPDWSNTVRRQVGGLQARDMNGDGLVDVVVGCYISNSFPPYDDWHNLIYYNTGGQLETVASWVSADEVSTGDVQVGLINDDEYPDIFSCNGGTSASVIYFGTASGPSTNPAWSSNEPGNAWNNYAQIFDIDHDGDNDVITANQGFSQFDAYRPLFVFYSNEGVLETAPSWQADMSIQGFLALADWDGDGWEDLAVSKWVNFESAIYKNVKGTFQTTPIWTTGDTDSDKGVAWADVDDNGWPDLALGHDPTQLWSNTSSTLSVNWTSAATYHGHSDIRFEDVDCDGDLDLAECHFADGKVHIYLNVGGVLESIPSWTYDSPTVGTAIAFGDINGNGRPDLIVGNSGDPCVKVFYAADKPTCPADLTGPTPGEADGNVDALDFLLLISQWGTPCVGTCEADITGPGDVPDGNVDSLDFLALIAQWGSPGNCPTP